MRGAVAGDADAGDDGVVHPGAALLATAVAPSGGFAEAVGAFAVTGVLLALTGLVPALGRLVRRIPTAIASAMLAGVLLSLCVAPFRDLPASPAAIGSVLVVWALLAWLAPRWAVPGRWWPRSRRWWSRERSRR